MGFGPGTPVRHLIKRHPSVFDLFEDLGFYMDASDLKLTLESLCHSYEYPWHELLDELESIGISEDDEEEELEDLDEDEDDEELDDEDESEAYTSNLDEDEDDEELDDEDEDDEELDD